MNARVNYEDEFCEKVPLNQTNLIQPHGVLLIVDSNDFRIIQLSENATDVFGVDYKELISKCLLDFIDRSQAQLFKERFKEKFSGKLPFTFSFPSGDHLTSVQYGDQLFIIEIEREKRLTTNTDSFLSIYQELKYAMTAVEAASTTEEACDVAVKELKRIASQVRRDIVRMVHCCNSGHPGGSLGCTDFLVALYLSEVNSECARSVPPC